MNTTYSHYAKKVGRNSLFPARGLKQGDIALDSATEVKSQFTFPRKGIETKQHPVPVTPAQMAVAIHFSPQGD